MGKEISYGDNVCSGSSNSIVGSVLSDGVIVSSGPCDVTESANDTHDFLVGVWKGHDDLIIAWVVSSIARGSESSSSTDKSSTKDRSLHYDENV